MSDKTTEEAAEEYVYKKHRWFAKERTRVNCKEDFIAGANSLSTTIAQLREENERYQWVSVEDRLPGHSERVLCASNNRIYWNSFEFWISPNEVINKKFLSYDYPFGNNDITHWMPLPPPPTEALTPKPPNNN